MSVTQVLDKETSTFMKQGFFTSLGIDSGVLHFYPNIYNAVRFSHIIDDFVDKPEVFSKQEKEYLLNLLETISFEDLDSVKAVNDFLFVMINRKQEEQGMYQGYNIQENLDRIRSITSSVGGQYNSYAYEISMLQMMVAGFVQTASSKEQEDGYMEAYKKILNAQTGEPIEYLNKFQTDELISRASGLQLMFYALVEPVHFKEQIALIANFDTIIAPLVYLQNSAEEQNEQTGIHLFNANYNGHSRAQAYMYLIEGAIKNLDDLVFTNPYLYNLYIQKRKQLEASFIYIFKRSKKEGEIFTQPFSELYDMYQSLLLKI